ncbi:hypothetical protein KBD20_02940 [Candidatus Saccharibacteria bacterium]|nr:hypothetical protein [Candidatus Saccharibacteria bacterium]
MATETQQLELPARLEPYGSAAWHNVPGTTGLHNIVQLEQRITDGIVTIFDAWKEDGGVDGYRFHHGVNAIGHDLLDSSIAETNSRMASDGYEFCRPSATGPYWDRPVSMGSIVFVENDRSPLSHHTPIHLSDDYRGMTNDESYSDTRIQPEGGTPGLYPDRRWVDRVVACAGFLAFRVDKFVDAAQTSDDFIGDFFQQRIATLQQRIGRYGLTISGTEGIERLVTGGVEPYEGIAVRKGADDIVEVRRAVKPGGHLPGSGVEYGYRRTDKIIEAVNADGQFVSSLKDLVFLGGIDGPIQELVTA